MHEAHFLSGWLREDGEGKDEETGRLNKDVTEESKSEKREVEGRKRKG